MKDCFVRLRCGFQPLLLYVKEQNRLFGRLIHLILVTDLAGSWPHSLSWVTLSIPPRTPVGAKVGKVIWKSQKQRERPPSEDSSDPLLLAECVLSDV